MSFLPGIGSGIWGGSHYLKDLFKEMGLVPSLLLDATDPVSYPGTGSQWFDVSGNGGHFYLGTSSVGDAAEPTFVGMAGAPNSYFSLDGADYFRMASTPTYINNMSKDNAKFSALVFSQSVYASSLFGNNGGTNSFGTGVHIAFASDHHRMIFRVVTDAEAEINVFPAAQPNQNEWQIFGVALDEAAGLIGDGRLVVDEAHQNFAPAYPSPTGSNASYPLELGARGNVFNPAVAGTKISSFALFDQKVLTEGDFRRVNAFCKDRAGVGGWSGSSLAWRLERVVSPYGPAAMTAGLPYHTMFAGTKPGWFALMFASGDGGFITPPSGFDLIRRATVSGVHVSLYAKKLDGTEATTGYLTNAQTAYAYACFQPNKTWSTYQDNDTGNTQATSADPSPQTITSGSASGPCIVWGAARSTAAGTAVSSSPAMDKMLSMNAIPTGDIETFGFKIYNSSPVNHTWDMVDKGVNTMISGHFTFPGS